MQRLPQFLPRCNKRRRLGQGREVGMPRVACDDLLLCGASSLPFLGVAVVLWLWWCPGWWERKMWAHGIKGGHTSWKSWPVGFYAEDRYNLGRKAEFHTCFPAWRFPPATESYTKECSEVSDSSHVLPAESQRPYMCSAPYTCTTGLRTTSLKVSVSVIPGSPNSR